MTQRVALWTRARPPDAQARQRLASTHSRIEWAPLLRFEDRALATKTEQDLLKGLLRSGFHPPECTTGDEPVLDVVAFTSPRAVDALFRAIALVEPGEDTPPSSHNARSTPPLMVLAGGPSTAQALRSHGVSAKTCRPAGARGVADAVLQAFAQQSARVLFVSAESPRDELEQRLRAAGHRCERLAVYRSVEQPLDDALVRELASLPVTVAVHSPRAGRALCASFDNAQLPARWTLVAGGTTTAEALTAAGLAVAAVAPEPTDSSLARSMSLATEVAT